MRTIALIRCTGIGPAERSLAFNLNRAFPGRVHYVVEALHRPPPASLPAQTAVMDGALAARLGLRRFPAAGWQCGDYAYYAARLQLPAFDFAWLIEPDVGMTFSHPSQFFRHYADDASDFLAPRFGERSAWWYWYQSMLPHARTAQVHGGSYPITRLSARAIDVMMPARAAICAVLPPDADDRTIPNDEAFTATALMDAGLVCADLCAKVPPAVFHEESFSTGMMVDPRELVSPRLADRIIHSVRGPDEGRGRLRHLAEVAPGEWRTARRRIRATLGDRAWADWTRPEA